MFIRNLPIPCCLAFLLIGLWNCESEIDILTDEYKTVPIITALINPWDSVHSIRVQRTFLIRDKDGAKLQDSDSLYFNKVDIHLSGIFNGEKKFSYNFEKLFIEKDSGNFTGEGHYIYQLNQKFPISVTGREGYSSGRPNIDYLAIEIYIEDIDTLISRNIPVYAPVHIYNQPQPSRVVIYGDYVSSFHCNSQSNVADVLRTGELEFRFHISEYGDSFGYDTVYTYKFGAAIAYRFDSPERLLNKILMSLDLSRDSVKTRVFHCMDLYWVLTEPAYAEYNQVLAYWQGMIDYPYSQIPGMYGIIITKVDGLLSGLVLEKRAMDSLCDGQDYKHLNFKQW